jgi:hypothetical protein
MAHLTDSLTDSARADLADYLAESEQRLWAVEVRTTAQRRWVRIIGLRAREPRECSWAVGTLADCRIDGGQSWLVRIPRSSASLDHDLKPLAERITTAMGNPVSIIELR